MSVIFQFPFGSIFAGNVYLFITITRTSFWRLHKLGYGSVIVASPKGLISNDVTI